MKYPYTLNRNFNSSNKVSQQAMSHFFHKRALTENEHTYHMLSTLQNIIVCFTV